jgi:hypothetical protein
MPVMASDERSDSVCVHAKSLKEDSHLDRILEGAARK